MKWSLSWGSKKAPIKRDVVPPDCPVISMSSVINGEVKGKKGERIFFDRFLFLHLILCLLSWLFLSTCLRRWCSNIIYVVVANADFGALLFSLLQNIINFLFCSFFLVVRNHSVLRISSNVYQMTSYIQHFYFLF